MNTVRLLIGLVAVALGPLLVLADMGSYFQFIQPTAGTEWVNGQTNPVIWKKGLLDGVPMFDLELARLSEDGLIYVALNVNALSGALDLFIQDVAAGDDYYLLFINSTHGGMHAISPRFTILTSGTSPNASAAAGTAVAGATTLSISGGPNPTAVFATTFSPIAGGALPRLGDGLHGLMGVGAAVVAAMVGAAWVVL